ncbi:MAG TPA: hypothetical protein VL996_10755 [Methylocella sp.]|nr:hypothetical protein [Methylocella sp.]
MILIPDKSDILAFRERFRSELLERLVLTNAMALQVLASHLSVEQSHKSLTEWLDKNSQTADQVCGKHFGDPALTALYADEVKDVTERMKAIVDTIKKELITQGF